MEEESSRRQRQRLQQASGIIIIIIITVIIITICRRLISLWWLHWRFRWQDDKLELDSKWSKSFESFQKDG